ncbi:MULTISPECIES: Na+/H+ antiporter NhaC family protein [Bacillaceae]|uniref:Na+/H+ antiporter NhaC family protein n=1 Tax=Bacillaceae TaxID=186817 RepID=UPI001C5990D1|nr:Na+/H+ antiporter NhaC family protein [Rossellomorea sp. YZS02]MBW3111064.1 Na+/H+ antiporter NhaC family protein [Bacillus sp. MCCB 382]MDX8344187.1 Na+/H+ antiporter NhaC family protein [Rossellomorea sp. YZS02]
MENTIYSLLPPLLAILMVILTRRVLLSLGVGIVASAFLLADLSIPKTFSFIWDAFKGIFVADGGLNTWNVYIIFFLLILGVITAFVNISGGSRAFGEWAMKRVKTRQGAQLLAAVLGIIIFIDDYFNALAVGQVSRPITDRHRISRAKLAYIIDSTSAPICVVSPISSWGAYIIGIIGSILTAHSITEYTAFSAFIQMIPMNLYVWAAVLLVVMVAYKGLDFGKMKEHEVRAIETGDLYDPGKEIPGELKNDLPVSSKGSVGDLVWPIVALVIGTVSMMLWTGYQAVGSFDLLPIFENTDVTKSLLYGGLFGLVVALIFFLRQVSLKGIEGSALGTAVLEGIKSMLPAVYILIFAWTIVTLIDQLQTGTYLAGLVEQSNLPMQALPVILFLVAGIMAFSTGTSWGSFGILLPIAGEIAAASDVTILLPAMAAVLAGSVLGDHCSPISDTTILSSTGAGSNHIDHVITQLPYAIIGAVVAAIGYLVLGFTGSTILGLVVVIILILAIAFLFGEKAKPASAE